MFVTPPEERKEVFQDLRCAPTLRSLFNAMQRVDPPLTNLEYLQHIRPMALRLHARAPKAAVTVAMTCCCPVDT